MTRADDHSDKSAASLQATARKLGEVACRAFQAGDRHLAVASAELSLRLSSITDGLELFRSKDVFLDYLRDCGGRREPRTRRLPRVSQSDEAQR